MAEEYTSRYTWNFSLTVAICKYAVKWMKITASEKLGKEAIC
jgi:hypothetical protein